MKPYRPFARLLCILSLLAAAAPMLRAQEALPYLIGPNNAGREFYLAFPANWDIPSSAQYYIRLYVTSNVRTAVRVSAGANLKKTFFTKPFEITAVDLTPIEAQMFTRNDVAPVPADQVYRGRAVHIQADAPVIVYGMNRTSYTSDGMLALPVNALGREYVAASYSAVIGVTQELPSQLMVIAPYDSTVVTISQPMATPNHTAGEKVTVTLNSGDVYSAMTLGYGGDMSGALITATKPVAVTAGQNCTYVPNQINYCCCDHLTEMLLPVESWGRHYQAVPFQTRKKGDFYRIFAGADTTAVHINGVRAATLARRGGDEGIGWFEYRADGKGLQEFTADKPFYVAQYNTSQAYDGVPSDPFFLALIPIDQYATRSVFSTPNDDFPQNYLNLVADSATFNRIEIASGPTGAWEPLWKYSGTGPRVPFPTRVKGDRLVGVTIDLKPGTYRLRAPKPFAGYLYGFSAYDSYGYPLGALSRNRVRPDSLAPDATFVQSCDGTVAASIREAPNDPLKRTNLSAVEIDADSSLSYNYAVSVAPFQAGVSASATAVLTVVDPTKPARAVLVSADMAGHMRRDTFLYRPFSASIDRKLVSFGAMNVGDTRRMPVTITNLSPEPTNVREAILRFGDRGFKLIKPTGPFTLGPAGSPSAALDAEVEFTATADGSPFVDSLGLRDTCGTRYIARLEALAGTPVITVTDHDFGTVRVGMTATDWRMAVKNAGTSGSVLTVTGVNGPADNVVITLPNGMPAPFPWMLKAGEVKEILVRFTPTAERQYIDTITFTRHGSSPSDDPNGIVAGAGTSESAVEQPSARDLRVDPNPTHATALAVTCTASAGERLNVTLVDAVGRVVRNQEMLAVADGSTLIRLDIHGLPSGRYVCVVEGPSGKASMPVVVID